MEASLKAKELKEKFIYIYAAIFCVDEIIKALEITTGHCDLRLLDRQEVQSDFDYWNKVKQELRK